MAAPGVWLRWEALTFEVATPEGSKRLLHGVSGQLLPGELLACMGPSGSGKTSLVRLLAGRRLASSGAVALNGAPLHLPTWRRASGFVAQATVFLDTLTVRETINYTALLRLDRRIPTAAKLARAAEVLALVDLCHVGDTRIGSDVAGGISGGERRRLSIAMEVVHSPRCLLLDEPTSGLDAASAQAVGTTLRAMATDHGTSSFTTIHQPRSSLLACFDSLLLLSHGRCVYSGLVGPLAGPDAPGVLSFFHSALKVRCPAAESPADWLLDVLQQRRADEVGDGRGALADLLAEEFAASQLAVSAMTPPADPPAPLPMAAGASLFPTSWLSQFGVLWRRTLLYKLREPAAVMTQATTACVMPLLVGGIFWRIQLGQSAINDRLAAVSFLVLMQSFQCIDQVLLFPKERAVYLRDHACGLHSTSAFFLARSLAEVPFIWAFAAVAATISYWMYGLQASASNYFTFLAIIVAVTDAGAGVLTSCGALSPTMEVGNLLATALLIILTLLDGFWRNLAQMPAWVRWVRVFSFSGFAVQAAAATEFRGLRFSCTPEEALTGCIPDGEAVLRRLSFEHTDVGANIGYIIVISCGSRLVAYLALRFLHTGQTFRERLAQP